MSDSPEQQESELHEQRERELQRVYADEVREAAERAWVNEMVRRECTRETELSECPQCAGTGCAPNYLSDVCGACGGSGTGVRSEPSP
jgi:DnaJ-class molecular chaperone